MRATLIDIDGIRTRYLHEGSGPALLLLHGLGVSGDTWIRNIDALGQHFAVYAPDMLGHGFTDPADLKGSPPQPHIVAHLRKLVDRLGLERYSVAGSSFGGLIAALMYFDDPQRVEKLIIIGSGSAFHPEDEQARTLRDAFQNAMSAIQSPTLETCRQRLANICYDPASVPEEILLTQLTAYALPHAVHAYEQTARGLMNTERSRPHRIIHRLGEIKTPTLIITGREDVRASWARAAEAQRQIPDAELVIFEKCGHLPYIEYPERFNEAVRAFLQR